MKQKRKKKQTNAPTRLPDFSLGDILNAPKPGAASRPAHGLGCSNCGSVKFISRGEVKVFRGQRMKVYHCHSCGQDFYKPE